jgi:hypothetical protein
MLAGYFDPVNDVTGEIIEITRRWHFVALQFQQFPQLIKIFRSITHI